MALTGSSTIMVKVFDLPFVRITEKIVSIFIIFMVKLVAYVSHFLSVSRQSIQVSPVTSSLGLLFSLSMATSFLMPLFSASPGYVIF